MVTNSKILVNDKSFRTLLTIKNSLLVETKRYIQGICPIIYVLDYYLCKKHYYQGEKRYKWKLPVCFKVEW